MNVFVDTSAFLAVLDVDAVEHQAAHSTWCGLLDDGERLWCTSFVLVETCALLQARLGIASLESFTRDVRPLLVVDWLGEPQYDQAVAIVLAAGRRRLSLVDCASFDCMRRHGIDRAFTLDAHFLEQGFTCIPSPEPASSA